MYVTERLRHTMPKMSAKMSKVRKTCRMRWCWLGALENMVVMELYFSVRF